MSAVARVGPVAQWAPDVPARPSERRYRSRWTWSGVTWASHCGNCLANCTYRRYVMAGGATFEEQSGNLPGVPDVPDMNPLGCQKGVAWSAQASSGDRILTPLRRVGARGEGRWEPISWDDAFGAIADAVIAVLEAEGPDGLLVDPGPEAGVLAQMARTRLTRALDAVALDNNATVSDIHAGHWITFGSLIGGSGADDTFRSEVVIVWNGNPAYTRIPYHHFLTEARYRGATVVHIGPDHSPSARHADLFVPVVPGTDAALALSMCRVLVEEGLADLDFVRSQTDLPFLVRTSCGRYLREADVVAGGRPDRFFVCSPVGEVHPVDPAHLPDRESASAVRLDATATVTLADGTAEEVTTVWNLLTERLASYTPEDASALCGVAPSVIRDLARLVAAKRTKLQNGLGSCKHHHGDLMERSMDLVLALSGNWGSPGTGFDTYIIALLEGEILAQFKQRLGAAAGEQAMTAIESVVGTLMANDPAMTEGKAFGELMRMSAPMTGITPPAFLLYHHGGFAGIWNRAGWSDSPRPVGDHIEEAESAGWWAGLVRPAPGTSPRVLIHAGTNILRRTRGGQRVLLDELWPKLELAVTVDWRMNTAALHSDIVLPVAVEGERLELHAANSHSFERMLSEKAFEPAGDSRTEWEVFDGIGKAVAARAASRGLEGFRDHMGRMRPYADLAHAVAGREPLRDAERALDEVLRDSAMSGNLPAGTSLASCRATGWVRPERLPGPMAAMAGADLVAGEPFVALRAHVAGGVPYPTLTGRAQFYVDHPWFLEAGEELPCHKEPPAAGGDHPLVLTGGHPRWSIHASNTTNPLLLGTTRGGPACGLNPVDAAARSIGDGDVVEVFNDLGALRVPAKLSASVRPGQVVLYASWEPYLFESWRDTTWVEPGLVKWLHFAGGYGHLAFSPMQWQPTQSDRVFRVDVRAVVGES